MDTNGKMDETFLSHASDILADTDTGLSGTDIVRYCNEYAIHYDVTIPINKTSDLRMGGKAPNKRTALLNNLQKFNALQQFNIIKE